MTRLAIVGVGFALALGLATAANAETVTGEVIDTFCYSTMGAKGASHKQCGIDCAKKGIPVALLENRNGQGLRPAPEQGQAGPSRRPDQQDGKRGHGHRQGAGQGWQHLPHGRVVQVGPCFTISSRERSTFRTRTRS
jgi:hypothetical protein